MRLGNDVGGNELIKRALEVLLTEGFRSFAIKTYRTLLVKTVNPWAASKYGTNSKAYWDTRLRFAWGQVGGGSQTYEFANAMRGQLQLRDLGPIDSVLDFGCATGDSIPVLREIFNYSSIYIHELSEVGVRRALEKYRALRPMKWDGGVVDFTYTSNVIEHVNDPSEFVLRLTEVSNRHILIQCPWDERGQNGGHITPEEPQGEHVWTIDQEFLIKHIPTVDWSWVAKFAEVPNAWPGGKQLFLLGTRLSKSGTGSITYPR
jgi:hypothetical protein